mgnify:CR=1 FL=1
MERNGEGYVDITAQLALEAAEQERLAVGKRISELMQCLRWVAEKSGFAIVNRVRLRDLETGKEYK